MGTFALWAFCFALASAAVYFFEAGSGSVAQAGLQHRAPCFSLLSTSLPRPALIFSSCRILMRAGPGVLFSQGWHRPWLPWEVSLHFCSQETLLSCWHPQREKGVPRAKGTRYEQGWAKGNGDVDTPSTQCLFPRFHTTAELCGSRRES